MSLSLSKISGPKKASISNFVESHGVGYSISTAVKYGLLVIMSLVEDREWRTHGVRVVAPAAGPVAMCGTDKRWKHLSAKPPPRQVLPDASPSSQVVDHDLDRPRVYAQRCAEPSGTNKACGLAYIFDFTRRWDRILRIHPPDSQRCGSLQSPTYLGPIFGPVATEELSYPFPCRTRKSRAPSPRVVWDPPMRE